MQIRRGGLVTCTYTYMLYVACCMSYVVIGKIYILLLKKVVKNNLIHKVNYTLYYSVCKLGEG